MGNRESGRGNRESRISPARAASATAETATAAEATKPAASTTAEASAAPPATAVPSAGRENDRDGDAAPTAAPSATAAEATENEVGDDEQDEDRERREATAARPASTPHIGLLHGSDRRGRIEREAELLRELLANAAGQHFHRRAVFPLHEQWNDLAAHRRRLGIGDEPFGALPRRDEALAAPTGARFLRHHEDDDAGVARSLANGGVRADAPRA